MANEKFDSMVDRAVEQAEIESLKRRERKIIEDIDFILRHYAAEDDDDDEYGEDEFDVDDWYEEESED